MIFTSDFQRGAGRPNAIAICQRLHQYKGMRTCEALRPASEMLRLGGDAFRAAYRAQLAALDPHAIAREIGDGAVLLCWERDPADCHRSLVAAWLRAAGYEVRED